MFPSWLDSSTSHDGTIGLQLELADPRIFFNSAGDMALVCSESDRMLLRVACVCVVCVILCCVVLYCVCCDILYCVVLCYSVCVMCVVCSDMLYVICYDVIT
jgi:hypothetical protein